jgi:hypothetical protein
MNNRGGSMDLAAALGRRLAEEVGPLAHLQRAIAMTEDPRDRAPRPPPFDYHNCWKCHDGAKPCVNGNPFGCEFLHARND